jgi:hypothetical protein
MPRLTITIDNRPYLAALVPPTTTEADAAALQARIDALRAAGALTEAVLAEVVSEAHGRLWADTTRGS